MKVIIVMFWRLLYKKKTKTNLPVRNSNATKLVLGFGVDKWDVFVHIGKNTSKYMYELNGWIEENGEFVMIDQQASDSDKSDLVKKFVHEHKGEKISVIGGFYTLEHYLKLKEKLKEIDISINSMYLRKDDSYDKLTEKEKMDIDVFSRWTGDSSDYIKHLQDNKNKDLFEMTELMQKDGIKIEWLANKKVPKRHASR